MAMHACIPEADVVEFPSETQIRPVTVTYGSVPPFVQQLHMVSLHKLPRLNALFNRHLLNNWGINLWLRLHNVCPDVVDKGKCNYCDKHEKSCYYFPAVIHFSLPPRFLLFREGVQALNRASCLFLPLLRGRWLPIRACLQLQPRVPSNPSRGEESPCLLRRYWRAYLLRICRARVSLHWHEGIPPSYATPCPPKRSALYRFHSRMFFL